MKIYHISRRDKTWKDKKNITLYHISHENFTRFSPKSNFRNQYKGVYLSPSYRSLIRDWSSYVKNKKAESHPLHQYWNEAWKEKNTIKTRIDNNTATEEDKARLDKLEEKIDKINESLGSDSFKEQDKGYKTLYLYTSICPPEVYKEAQDIFNGVLKADEEKAEAQGKEINWSFWGWGEQIFIPNYLLDQLKITNVKKIDSASLSQERSQVEKKPHHITPTEENTNHWFPNTSYLEKQEAKEREEAERQERINRREKVKRMNFYNPKSIQEESETKPIS